MAYVDNQWGSELKNENVYYPSLNNGRSMRVPGFCQIRPVAEKLETA